jgi:hypothetical protein
MAERILKARFIKDGHDEYVDLDDVNDNNYENYYKGYLFCPNQVCEARISYASGKKRTYFKTWQPNRLDGEIVDQHVGACPYRVVRGRGDLIGRIDPNSYSELSEEHVKEVLRRAHEKLVNPEKEKERKNRRNSKKNKGSSTVIQVDDTLSTRGKPGLKVADMLTKEKEPRVYSRSISEILDEDYASVKCVYGFVESMTLNSDYPFITLKEENGRKARILFSEAFSVNNGAIFNNLSILKDYIESQKRKGQNPVACCLGQITRDDDFEINIVFENIVSLAVDNKGYYRIAREIQHII